jgi:hypothetical protein
MPNLNIKTIKLMTTTGVPGPFFGVISFLAAHDLVTAWHS